jgi:hypothetical protein
VTPQGEVFPVPHGAFGPIPANNGQGIQFTGGSGGLGLYPNVWGPGTYPEISGMRIMNPTQARGPSPGYPGGYISYWNTVGQTVNPLTGQDVPPANPWWHIPLLP